MAEAGTAAGAGQLFGEILSAASRVAWTETKDQKTIGTIPRVSYGRFLKDLHWKQGQHITEIGPTGYGKTTLAVDLLTRRDYVIAFGTKKKDDTLDKLIRTRGYRRIQTFGEIRPEDRKVVLWPNIASLESADEITALQREAFREALFGAFRQGGWCVYADELRYITARLNLKSEMELLWEQGRSSDVSIVAGYQRPRNIPLLAYDQPEHLVFFKETDYENLDRMAQVVSWIDRKMLINTIAHLAKFDFVYLNKEEERAVVSRVEL